MYDERPRSYKGVAVAALSLVFLHAQSTSAAAVETNDVPIRFKSPDGIAMIVQVSINGSRPYDFLFDTGSTTTVIDPYLMSLQKLPELAPGSVITVAGSSPIKLAVASIGFGPIRTSPLPVVIRLLSALREVDPEIHGILGQDVLGQMDYLIDNRKGVIALDTRGEVLDRLSGERIAMTQGSTPGESKFAGAFVPVRLGGSDARIVDLLLDSGSAFPVLSSKAAGIDLSTLRVKKTIKDDNGSESDAFATQTRVGVGKLSINAEVLVTTAGLGQLNIDGLLPTACFSSVYVSNSGGFVIFEPDDTSLRSENRPWHFRHFAIARTK